MANISYFHHHVRHMDHPDLDDSYHFFYNNNNNNNPINDDDAFSDPESVILSAADLLDRENQVSFVMDILQDRVEQSSSSSQRVGVTCEDDSSLIGSGFGVIDDVEEEEEEEVELGLGSGLGLEEGLGFLSETEGRDPNEEVYYYGGVNEEEEEEEESVVARLRWDSLWLDENEADLGWEEVEDEDEEASVSLSISPIIAPEDLDSVEGEEERVGGGGMGNVEWEVLLNANNLDSGPDQEVDVGEYDTLFWQFVESESVLLMGRPPAAKAAVESLLSVVVMEKDVEVCAVCKDEIGVGGRAKQLPCTHRYHGDCILPWLGIRNTCPVCRHELPTDDPDYERRKVAVQRRI